METSSRPVLRWHGGKWLLAPWIIGHFGPHRCYVEPFGGAASVLLRKPISHAEIYNDLDDGVVNLFRVLQDPATAERLLRILRLTPFARSEFALAYEPSDDPVEEARRLIVRSFMGHGSTAHTRAKTGFRANSTRSGTVPARDWKNYADALPAVIDRMLGVIIENRDAREVMAAHDGADTLHYVDPPYLPATRNHGNPYCRKHLYSHELTEADHSDLLASLCALEGMVILSGYPSELYDDALPDWLRIDRAALADGAKPRTECLWLNPAAASAMPRPGLFEAVA